MLIAFFGSAHCSDLVSLHLVSLALLRACLEPGLEMFHMEPGLEMEPGLKMFHMEPARCTETAHRDPGLEAFIMWKFLARVLWKLFGCLTVVFRSRRKVVQARVASQQPQKSARYF